MRDRENNKSEWERDRERRGERESEREAEKERETEKRESERELFVCFIMAYLLDSVGRLCNFSLITILCIKNL